MEASLDSALSQVGIVEKTRRNDGEVEKYLNLFGLKKGQPYCAAGQYWCFYTASTDIGLHEAEIPIIKSAGAYRIFKDAKERGIKVRYRPAKHDLIVWRKRKSVQGHIERIVKVSGKGNVFTVGFNTKEKHKKGRQYLFKDGIYIIL